MSIEAKPEDIVNGVLDSLVSHLRSFFGTIFAQPVTYGWTWESPVATRCGEVLWFVAPAQAVLLGDDGTRQSLEYRLSGVLREQSQGVWVFELFNGSEPAQG